MRISSRFTALCLLALCLLAALCASSAHAQSQYYAGAVLRGSQLAPSTIGVVAMLQPGGPGTNTTIIVAIKGLPVDKSYAFHIHSWGDLSSGIGARNISTSATGVGAHFNPMGVSHACGYGNVRHVGDIGNFTQTGTETIQYFVSELVDLSFSNRTVIGRSFVVHTSGDQCTAVGNGNAGQPLMQGVIGIINPNNTNLQAFLEGAGMPRATANSASLPLASTGASSDIVTAQPASAVAYLYRKQTAEVGGQAVGVVRFFFDTTTSLVNVSAYITGLTASSVFGFHVHTWGDESDTIDPASTTAFNLAGGHFSPIVGATHGYPPASNRHLGDMGNITSDANGTVRFSAQFDLLDLVTFNTSIIGRAVIVHALRDDGTGANGNAGARLMGGVIGVSGQQGANVDVTTVDFTPYTVPVVPSSTGTWGPSSTGSQPTSAASLTTGSPLSVVVAAASTALLAALLMMLL